jgi:hypothetical protein
MKLTLEEATEYANKADQILMDLHQRIDQLRGKLVRGPVGSLGFRTVSDVVIHMKMRELQIATARETISELESTHTDSAMVLESARRLGIIK